MDAVVGMTGQGGWPMTVFLTPKGEPFYGGTYYPPEPRHGIPSFRQVLTAVAEAWRDRRGEIAAQAGALTEQLRRGAQPRPSSDPLTTSLLTTAVSGMRTQFDPEWGGFGGAPKFPPAPALEFLLRRGETKMVEKTLDAMALGGLASQTRTRLFELREQRPKPLRDDKVIASWNGLALAALAEAGRRLDRADLLDAARALGEFLLGPLSTEDGRLFRTWRDGRAHTNGFLEDYADVANGLYELHVATGELRWLEEARRLVLLAVELFGDEEQGGFFHPPADGQPLVNRKKELDDHPTPSGNSMLAYVLLRLARLFGDDDLDRQAVGVFRLAARLLPQAPSAFGHLLCALDFHFAAPRELAIVRPPASAVARAALAPFDPSAVVAFGPAEGVPLLDGKGYVDGRPAVYVCERFVCRAPVTEPAALRQ